MVMTLGAGLAARPSFTRLSGCMKLEKLLLDFNIFYGMDLA